MFDGRSIHFYPRAMKKSQKYVAGNAEESRQEKYTMQATKNLLS